MYVYNGMPLLAPTDDDLKPEYGEIKLIDNDSDKAIDVVIIWDYKSYIVKTATNTKITFRENEDNVVGEPNFFYGLCLKNTTMTVESKINWAILLSLDIFLPICQFDNLAVCQFWHTQKTLARNL